MSEDPAGNGKCPDAHTMRYDPSSLRTFTREVAVAAGCSGRAAVDLADVTVEAELRGVTTHGFRRLEAYVGRIADGAVDGVASPVVHGSGSVVSVDGRNAIGQHVGCIAADIARERARTEGVAVAAVKNSNHFGFAGYYATRIASAGMMALVTTNGTPCVAPPNTQGAFFSNNPLAVAAPVGKERFFELDLSMSLMSRDWIRRSAEQGEPLPTGVAVGPDGVATQDPEIAMLGSMEPMAGLRGYALLFALELFASVLSMANSADEVPRKEMDSVTPEGLGHFMLAIHIDSLGGAEAFAKKFHGIVDRIEGRSRISGESPPRYPGQRRWTIRRERKVTGIPLDDGLVSRLRRLGESSGIRFPAAGMTNVVSR